MANYIPSLKAKPRKYNHVFVYTVWAYLWAQLDFIHQVNVLVFDGKK